MSATRRSCSEASSDSSALTCWISGSGLPPSTMSVPRPAMLVAIVTIRGRPAWITISASRACCLALSTWCGRPSFASIVEMSSEFSMEVVPSSTGWPRSWQSFTSLDDGLELLLGRDEDLVVGVLADHRAVRGDEHRLQAVDVRELEGLGVGRAGHPRELLVEAEVVLEGDRGERLALVLDRDAFLGLHRLVQALGPAPALHHAARELVDDHHLVVLDHVVLVAVVERVRAHPA